MLLKRKSLKICDFRFYLVYSAFFIFITKSLVLDDIDQLEAACKVLKEKTNRLKYVLQDLRDNNEKLHYRVRNLKEQVNDVEIFHRTENLEILGVPQTKEEDLMEILRNISVAIDLKFNACDISSVWRQHEGSGNKYKLKTDIESIIVRFVSRTKRNKWLKRGRKKIVIDSKTCLPRLSQSEIYINEHLTNSKKSLIKMAKLLEEENKIPYAWLKDGHLYIRQMPKSKAIKIKSVSDLKNLGLLS